MGKGWLTYLMTGLAQPNQELVFALRAVPTPQITSHNLLGVTNLDHTMGYRKKPRWETTKVENRGWKKECREDRLYPIGNRKLYKPFLRIAPGGPKRERRPSRRMSPRQEERVIPRWIRFRCYDRICEKSTWGDDISIIIIIYKKQI